MTSRHARTCLGGIFDYANKKDRLTEVELELGDSEVWNDPDRAQELGRERSALELVVETIETLDTGIADALGASYESYCDNAFLMKVSKPQCMMPHSFIFGLVNRQITLTIYKMSYHEINVLLFH